VRALAPVVTGAAAGLAAAHAKGVIHRDLKPDNIFLAEGVFGAPMQVKLLDFGISKVIGFDKITRTGQVLGTPRYMAPEQLMADRDMDARVDVYCLGVILYEALAGQPPFMATEPSALIVSILNGSATPLRALRPDLSVEAEAFVARAMARSPEARHASAPELAAAFLELPECARSQEAGRAGMRTSVLGGMGAAAPFEPKGAGVEPFKPATFSELEATAAPAPIAAASTRAMRRGALAPTPVAMARPPIAEPGPPPPRPDVVQPQSPQGVIAPAPPRRPARRVQALAAALVLALLAAGSGAALWSILADSPEAPATRPRRREAPTPVSVAGDPAAPSAADVPDVIVGAVPPTDFVPLPPNEAERPSEPAATEVAPAPSAATPTSIAPVEDAPSEASPRRATRSRRARAPRAAPPPAAEEEAPPPPPFVYEAPAAPAEETPADLLRTARQELQSGDARACVSTASRALERGGGAAAYLLEGDCYLQLGDSEHAGKAYERFCRAMPTHPAVVRVLPIVEAAGGRCD
jgi:serine/threonine-protein kinase